MGVISKPHAVFIPFPVQSHIKALLKLAKLLYHKGFHVTFVNTEFNHKRFLTSQASDSLPDFPGFCFETIPDGLPPSDNLNASQDVFALLDSLEKNLMVPPFKELLQKLNDDASSTTGNLIPPVSCIFSDGFMKFTIDVASELGIPDVKFFSISASTVMAVKQLRALKERGFTPLKDESYMDAIIDWIPGMKDIWFRDLPSFVRTTDPNDPMFNYIMESADRSVDASAVIVLTFDALEQDVLNALSSIYPKLYTIAPLQLLLNQVKQDDDPPLSYSLWKEEGECLQWLDKQKPNSVVYVNFGSLATMESNQLVEFAMGLVHSNHPFLWIIRPDLVEGEKAVLPNEFTQKINEGRGFVASWCDQEEVLNHSSVGGFVTHSGWNSIMESLTSGVAMLSWPCFGDQQTNCWLARGELGVAIEIERDAKREDVERLVNELMEGEKGKVLKKKVTEWRRLAHEAAAPMGSSSTSLDELLNQLLVSVKNINSG